MDNECYALTTPLCFSQRNLWHGLSPEGKPIFFVADGLKTTLNSINKCYPNFRLITPAAPIKYKITLPMWMGFAKLSNEAVTEYKRHAKQLI